MQGLHEEKDCPLLKQVYIVICCKQHCVKFAQLGFELFKLKHCKLMP